MVCCFGVLDFSDKFLLLNCKLSEVVPLNVKRFAER